MTLTSSGLTELATPVSGSTIPTKPVLTVSSFNLESEGFIIFGIVLSLLINAVVVVGIVSSIISVFKKESVSLMLVFTGVIGFMIESIEILSLYPTSIDSSFITVSVGFKYVGIVLLLSEFFVGFILLVIVSMVSEEIILGIIPLFRPCSFLFFK